MCVYIYIVVIRVCNIFGVGETLSSMLGGKKDGMWQAAWCEGQCVACSIVERAACGMLCGEKDSVRREVSRRTYGV